MNFEEMQKMWQSPEANAKVTIDADVLLKEIRRNQQYFKAVIFRRAVVEVGTSVVMTAGFLVWGWFWHWWSLYLLALACLVVGTFFVVDRRRQRGKGPVNNDSLHACIAASLGHVQHQIWLLKNIFWWYLLPPSIGLAAVTAQLVWSVRGAGPAIMIVLGSVLTVIFSGTYWFVYRINQRAVKSELELRRQELEELLTSLK
jgi:hypothetical protein